MEDWIPRGQVTGLYGVGGIHKTNLLIQLMLAKSEGLFIPRKTSWRTGPVYGLFCEDTREEIVRRASRIAKVVWGFNSLADFPDFHFASLVGVIDKEFAGFDAGADGAHARGAGASRRDDRRGSTPRSSALDTLPHFYGGNEIVRRDVTQFVPNLKAVGIAR